MSDDSPPSANDAYTPSAGNEHSRSDEPLNPTPFLNAKSINQPDLDVLAAVSANSGDTGMQNPLFVPHPWDAEIGFRTFDSLQSQCGGESPIIRAGDCEADRVEMEACRDKNHGGDEAMDEDEPRTTESEGESTRGTDGIGESEGGSRNIGQGTQNKELMGSEDDPGRAASQMWESDDESGGNEEESDQAASQKERKSEGKGSIEESDDESRDGSRGSEEEPYQAASQRRDGKQSEAARPTQANKNTPLGTRESAGKSERKIVSSANSRSLAQHPKTLHKHIGKGGPKSKAVVEDETGMSDESDVEAAYEQIAEDIWVERRRCNLDPKERPKIICKTEVVTYGPCGEKVQFKPSVHVSPVFIYLKYLTQQFSPNVHT
jgi:hypothetical protein